MPRTVHTFCRVCEPACGLLAEVDDDGRLAKLQPDRTHPVSKGFACPRGTAGVDIHHDPDRLDVPLERLADRLQERTWDEAIRGVATSLQRALDTYGPEGVGVYLGNPASFNSQLGIGMPELFRRLGVTRQFGSGTQDCSNKFAASAAVFGSRAVHPLPDVRNTDALLLLGSNWRVSKGSFISIPNAYRELMGAASRGAKIWFVNPRDTESAGERTGTTVPIKPDTDVYLLAALLHEIAERRGYPSSLDQRGTGLDRLRDFVAQFPAERVAPVCGIPAHEIRRLALEFADAPRAAAHMSTGVNMGRQGTLAYWLMQMLVFVTGNLDEIGGNVPGQELYPTASKARSDYGTELLQTEFGQVWRGELPGALLADHILDAGQPIRALFVIAGNPLLTIPGEARLRSAFEALDLLVSIDIYPSATTEYAHWLLPATDQFERADFNLALLGMQADPFMNWTPRVVEPLHQRKEEWWILARIAQELGLASLLDADDPDEARWARLDHMLARGGLTREQVTSTPHGLALGESVLPGRLFTEMVQLPGGRLDCCPAAFAPAMERCEEIFEEMRARPADQLTLITRRDSRMQNSWYANVVGMKTGERFTNPLGMHPEDAARLGLNDGDEVLVQSAWGEVTGTMKVDETVRQGAVAMEHGWGLQPSLRTSRDRPGVNVNALLPHGPGSYDPLSNMAHLTGVPVEVTRR